MASIDPDTASIATATPNRVVRKMSSGAIIIPPALAPFNAQLTANGEAPFQWKTVPQGAATSVWAAFVAPASDVGAHYCENCQVSQFIEAAVVSPVSSGVRPYALDPEHAKALWAKSEEMVQERF